MEDMTFFFFVALFIFIYSCTKLVLRYLRDTKMMSAEAIAEVYKQESEISAKKRQMFWLNIAGLLLGVGVGLIISFLVKTYGFADSGNDISTAAGMIIAGLIILFGSTGMLGVNIFFRKQEKKKEQ